MQTLAITSSLNSFSIISASGDDACKFLQMQFTQDVEKIPAGTAKLGAWCNAKGRMLASFYIYKKNQSQIYLLLSKDISENILKRLKMYVMRSKVVLSNVSGDFNIYGAWGGLANLNEDLKNSLIIINTLPAENKPLSFIIAGEDVNLENTLSANKLPLDKFNELEIKAGVARITSLSAGLFVPQMLNYESVDGVNFKKGCYPGQEVVARSQFRGAIKKRAYVASANISENEKNKIQAGQEIIDADGNDAGLIAQISINQNANNYVCNMIISVQAIAVQENRKLFIKISDNEKVEILNIHLPYELLEDI